MPDNTVTLRVNGSNYYGWKGISITRSVDQAAGTFSLDVTDKWSVQSLPLPIQPGDECSVSIGGQPVITGYVDKTSISVNATSISFSVEGRSKTCDLVDCSAVADCMEFKDQGLDCIANTIAGPFGLGVNVETSCGEAFRRHAVQPGETAFECIERAAAQRGVLLTDDAQGNLVLTGPGRKSAGDALQQGVNVLSITVDRDHKDRFSKYTVNAQEPSWDQGKSEPVANIQGEACDSNITRHRPMLVNSEMQGNCKSAQERAENEATCRAGQSTQVNVTVQDWRQSGGALWEENMLVTVNFPRAMLHGVLFVIDSVNYTVNDSGGTITQMLLKRPDAYMNNCSGEVREDPYD